MKIAKLSMLSSQREYKLLIGLMINLMGLFAILNIWILN
jgi:hypothetical protein